MSKFSLFSLILSVTVIVMLVELTANDYLKVNVDTNLLGQPQTTEDIAQIFDVKDETTTPENTTDPNLEAIPRPRSSVAENLPANPSFGINELREAGFFDPYISVITPISAIFGVLEIPQKFDNAVIQAQIMEDNSSVGIVQEFDFDTIDEAQELYLAIKQAGEAADFFDINETNGYGGQSFYLNHVVNTNQVFIVVRKENRIWALTYLKSMHPKFQELMAKSLK